MAAGSPAWRYLTGERGLPAPVAARAAGVRAIAVTWGAASEDELLAAEPDAVAHDVAELRTLLGL